MEIYCVTPGERSIFSEALDELEICLDQLIKHHENDLKEGPSVPIKGKALEDWQWSYMTDINRYKDMRAIGRELKKSMQNAPDC